MLAETFERSSGFVCRKARLVIATTSAMSLVCSLGLFYGRVESDEDALYLPERSRAVRELEWIEETFDSGDSESRGTKSLSMYCISSNVVRRNAMLDLFGQIEEVWSSKAKGSNTKLEDVAKLNGFGYPMESSPFVYWNKSTAAFLADDDWRGTLFRQPYTRMGLTEFDDNRNVVPTRIALRSLFGGLQTESEQVMEAKAIKVKFWVNKDLVTNENLRAADGVVLRSHKKKTAGGHLRCSLYTQTSYRDAVLRAIQRDMNLVALSILILGIVASLCFAGRRRRRTASWLLGPVAMISALLALASALGMWMFFGGYFHNLMGAVFFIVLGLGVDDAFVIVEAIDVEIENEKAFSSEDKVVSRAMRDAGVSILVTSTTDVSAFAAGACVSPIPAVQSFCAVAAISIALDFFFQVTFFLAVVSLTLRFPLPSEIVAATSRSTASDCPAEIGDEEQKATHDVTRMTPHHEPTRDDHATYSISRRIADGILSGPGRFLTFLATIALVALGTIGCSRLKMEYKSKWMAPSGSMVRDALDIEDKYFSGIEDTTVKVYSKHKGAPLFDVFEEYRNSVDKMRDFPWHVCDKFWLDGFDSSVEDDDDVWSRKENFDAESSLYALMGKRYSNSLVFSSQNETPSTKNWCSASNLPSQDYVEDPEATTKRVVEDGYAACATKIEFSWTKAPDKSVQLRRTDAAQRKLPSFMFVSISPSLEALSHVWNSVKLSVIVVAVAVTVSCLVLFGNMWAAILMLLVVAIIDVILLGGLYWMGEYINTITSISLTLAVGLGSDFSAHYLHAFLRSTDSNNCARDALERMLSPIAKGAGTTLLAVAPMAISTSYVIRLFGKIFSLMIILGFFMGVLNVPALLHTLHRPTTVSDTSILDSVSITTWQLQTTPSDDHPFDETREEGDAFVLEHTCQFTDGAS